MKHRTVSFYGDYFQDFFVKQRKKVKDKIIWTFMLIEEVLLVPEIYLKHIEGTQGLYEIRVRQGRDIFRIFCFMDADNLVVVTTAFQKKTQKTPRAEIDRALRIMQEYKENDIEQPQNNNHEKDDRISGPV